jgi:hypothetical protein
VKYVVTFGLALAVALAVSQPAQAQGKKASAFGKGVVNGLKNPRANTRIADRRLPQPSDGDRRRNLLRRCRPSSSPLLHYPELRRR